MPSKIPTLSPPPPRGEPAASPPPSGSAGATARQDARIARERELHVLEYRRLLRAGLTHAAAAAEIGLSGSYVERIELRYSQGGLAALRPVRPEPPPVTPPPRIEPGRAPNRHTPARQRWDTNARLFNLGRWLQLESQGKSYRAGAEEIGCSTATLRRLARRFREGGLLALESPPKTGRPPGTALPKAIPASVLEHVARLAVRLGPSRAWRRYAHTPQCQVQLSKWILARRLLPAAMLDAVRVKPTTTTTLYRGKGFTFALITKPKRRAKAA